MNQTQPSNTLAIVGLVLGIIAILFSFIPCIGTLAFFPGVIGLVLSVIAYLKAKDNGNPKGLAIGGIVVSLLACIIAAFWIFYIGNIASSATENLKEYTSCVEIEKDFETTQKELEELAQDDNASLSNITKMAKLGTRIGHLQGQADKLDCDLDLEIDMDEGAGEAEGEGETEGEAESIESEQGN